LKLTDHFIDLTGPGCHGKYARPEAVGGVLSRIGATLRDAVRMSVLHSSRRVGRPMSELSHAWHIRSGGQTAGPDQATRLLFKAPTLKDAAPALFDQGLLWEDGPNPEDTAFDLMGAVLRDVARQKRDSQWYDVDLLNRIGRFSGVLQRGVNQIQLGGHQLEARSTPAINRLLTDAAKTLVTETPEPRRTRMTGMLDMIRVSDRVFELVLKDGQRARAVWVRHEVVELAKYLNSDVTIEGKAVFRPSGGLLRMEAEAIAKAGEKDRHFSVMPRPAQPMGRRAGVSVELKRGESPFAAIYGKWPGEESDAEVRAALEEIS